LEAYRAASGINLSMSPSRKWSLDQLIELGMTPEDVTAVLNKLKLLVKTGAKGYTMASLDFRNAIQEVDKFEERALRCRQDALRKRPVPKQVPEVRNDGNGACSRLVEQKQPEPKIIDLRGTLINLANNLKAS
jgi:hypothetical protein